MGKVNIDRDNKNRVLLTELLPFEVPMLFSNEGFYVIVKENRFAQFFDRVAELSHAAKDKENRKYGIPFNYEIKKSLEGDTRTLSIMHPIVQYYFVELYKKYDSLMIHLCSKSPFSLRRISKVANYYYSPEFVFEEDEHKSSEAETEPDVLDNETRYLKSYYIYKPIDLIYKFYEKHEYQRLEQRFNFLMEFDITKCFYHIYTHSITWAVKNKETAKRNIREKSFENSFDKLMQLSNYNETNGILVGPEISRIFAEIILQQVDINVLNKIEKTFDIKNRVDFEIRRYVDDYFVFSNDKDILKKIQDCFEKELNYYKLYLNKSKSNLRSQPFLTSIAVGKRELNQLLIAFFKENIIEEEITNPDGTTKKTLRIKPVKNPYKDAQYFIKDFQCVVKRNSLTYDILSKEIIFYIKNKVSKILKTEKIEKKEKDFENFLLMVLDIVFYAYSVNINVNTTFKLAQLIVLICKCLEKSSEEIKHSIFGKVFKEADFALTNLRRKSYQDESNIEILNLIIALKKLGPEYLFTENRLIELFSSDKNLHNAELNYFHIITLLYYIDKNPDFESIQLQIESIVIDKFRSDIDPFSKAELTMLFFDFLTCPYTTQESKRNVMRFSKYVNFNTSNFEVDIRINEISDKKRIFMDWDQEIDLERVLKKKEFGNSY